MKDIPQTSTLITSMCPFAYSLLTALASVFVTVCKSIEDNLICGPCHCKAKTCVFPEAYKRSGNRKSKLSL